MCKEVLSILGLVKRECGISLYIITTVLTEEISM
jgi:hypothetical protein